jgi:hypothetical protein
VIATPFGIAVVIIGLVVLFRGSLLTMLVFVMVCSLMGGTAALMLPALGGSSVQPTSVALVFLILRAAYPSKIYKTPWPHDLYSNIFLIIFCLYGAITAFILPKVFEGQMQIVPMRAFPADYIFYTAPLQYSSQNITTAFYITGSVIASIIATRATANLNSDRVIVTSAVTIAWIHVGLGILGVVLTQLHAGDLLDVFRNANYAQLSQQDQGFVRINGIFPETSAYSAYAFVWFVFTTELWLRDVSPRATGFCAAGLAGILVFSTSSSAYVGLAGYTAILLLRAIVFPGGFGLRKGLQIGAVVIGVAIVVFAVAAFLPDLASALIAVGQDMTVEKMGSMSGQQRTFWALKGFEAFEVSRGLGIGAGSFRSSSLFAAILGSMGVVGITTFICHLLVVLKPWRISTFGRTRSTVEAVGVASGWAACVGLIPAAINASSPDPGILFGVLGGLALGFRLPPAQQNLRASQPRLGRRSAVVAGNTA